VATSLAAICEPAARGCVNWSLSRRRASRVISLATSAWRSRTTVAASTEVSVACSSRRMSRASLSSSRRCSHSLCNFESVTPQAGDRYGKGPEIRRIKSANCRRRFVHEGSFQAPCLARDLLPMTRKPGRPPAAPADSFWDHQTDLDLRWHAGDVAIHDSGAPLDFRARKGPHASPTRSQVTHGAAPDRS
jgi:hypothetical protein